MSLVSNYLKIIIRQVLRNQPVSFINILGLSIGFAVTFFIGLFILNELSFDKFHEKSDRIYRMTMHNHTGNYNMHWARVDANWTKNIAEEFPEVEHLIRFQDYYPRNIKIDNSSYRIEHAYSTDNSVFQVFDFKLKEGNLETALEFPYTTVLTESTAKKLFGKENPMNKEFFIIAENGDKKLYKVTGIMEDLPSNTHLPVNMLTSFANEGNRVGWAYTYLLLKEGNSITNLEKKMPAFIEANMAEEASTISLPFQSLENIHLNSNLAREITPNGNSIYLYLFASVGIFILLMSVINFINLNTAQSLKRMREIGVRKALGSSRNSLKFYFFTESFFVILLSTVLGLIGVYFCLPLLQEFLVVETKLWDIVPYILLLIAIVSFIAGYYPAFVLSKTHIIKAVKSKNGEVSNGSFSIKNILVSIQLILCIVLISAAFITRSQFSYLVDKKLGIEKEQILAITNLSDDVKNKIDFFKEYISGIPSVNGVTSVMQVPSDEIRDAGPIYAEGKVIREDENAPVLDIQVVDDTFLEVMNIDLLAGRNFKNIVTPFRIEQVKDTLLNYLLNSPREYIINETALKTIGWNLPEEAIGKNFSWKIGDIKLKEGAIVGVIKDYHQESLKNEIEPLVLIKEPIWVRHLLIKVEGNQTRETVAQIESFWQENFSDYPIEYAFLDDLYNQLYQSEKRQLNLIYLFSSLAILIAFLGIFGLISYALKTREKEIAIRKVLGASLQSITLLLSKQFFILTLIGISVGIPLTWWGMDYWLQNFAYRININLGYFLIGTLLIISVLASTILFQMKRLSKGSISETLRSE